MLFDKNHEIYCFEPSNLVMTDSASDESDDKKKTAMNENQVNSKKNIRLDQSKFLLACTYLYVFPYKIPMTVLLTTRCPKNSLGHPVEV